MPRPPRPSSVLPGPDSWRIGESEERLEDANHCLDCHFTRLGGGGIPVAPEAAVSNLPWKHLFTHGDMANCTQALRYPDGQIVLTFWLDRGRRVEKVEPDNMTHAQSMSERFLSMEDENGLPVVPCDETLDAALEMVASI